MHPNAVITVFCGLGGVFEAGGDDRTEYHAVGWERHGMGWGWKLETAFARLSCINLARGWRFVVEM